MLPTLDRSLLTAHGIDARVWPERVLQFGGGAFLRGFADWMIDRLNRAGHFGGSIVIVQSTGGSTAAELERQNGVYTLITRGIERGKEIDTDEVITSVSRAIDARTQWQDVLELARSPELRVVLSNTTEAGITTSEDDRLHAMPPTSFPAKLAAVLYERFRAFDGDASRGLIVLPCELIEANGNTLRRAVLDLAVRWNLPSAFARWVDEANRFCNTLVDRIVSGRPDATTAAAISERLGYVDALIDIAEPYHFWAIEAPPAVARELPFDAIGLDVVWADDIGGYRERKVRILNGAHTMTALAAFLAGQATVRECMIDPTIAAYVRRGLFDEILPALDLPRSDTEPFAAAVLDRFANPFLDHALLNIALNSASKFRVRVLPTLRTSIERFGKVPPVLSFSLAALMAFYRVTGTREDGVAIGSRASGVDASYPIRDDAAIIEAFTEVWSLIDAEDCSIQSINASLAAASIWGDDLMKLPGLAEAVRMRLQSIRRDGMSNAIKRLIRNDD